MARKKTPVAIDEQTPRIMRNILELLKQGSFPGSLAHPLHEAQAFIQDVVTQMEVKPDGQE